MRIFRSILFIALILPAGAAPLRAQTETVYATVYTNRLFIVGAGNPQTGLFRRAGKTGNWEHLGAPNIRAFGFDSYGPAHGRILYIAAGNGLHKSADGGRSWKITTDWRVTEVLSVAADRKDSNRVYISTPYGVWRTDDGCRSWKKKSAGLKSLFVSCVIIDARDPRRLFCATESGLYTSADRGERWRRTALPADAVRTVAQHPLQPQILAAGTEEQGLCLSSDGGATWRRAGGELAHQAIYAVAFDPEQPRVIACAGFDTGVYRTTDGGASWMRTAEGLGERTVHALALDPREKLLYAATLGRGVYGATDGDAIWFPLGLDSTKIWTVKCVAEE